MAIRHLILIFAVSALVYATPTPRNFLHRLIFVAKAFSVRSSLNPFLEASKESLLGRLMLQRPEIIGAVVWPYQSNRWDARTRLKRIEEHYKVLEEKGYNLDFPISGALKLFSLDDVYDKLHVVLDQPKWFIREGQLVLNLFLDKTRIFSIAFSLAFENDKVVAYVGAIQGRNIDGLLDIYRDITKATHGVRPRDLLFELFRFFSRGLGISKIYAVSDESRHQRGDYFGKNVNNIDQSLNYNEVWEERGGVKVSRNFYSFGMEPPRKNIEEVPSKKRALYRRRYELMASLESRALQSSDRIGEKSILIDPFYSL